MYYCEFDSPIGQLRLFSNGDAIVEIVFPNGNVRTDSATPQSTASGPFSSAIEQLNAYFGGDLKHFELPLAPAGTPFQQGVWQALQNIEYGDTLSYGELAMNIGKPTASRAVGAANGANPIPIVIPCHRVIGKSGKLTGFAGGLLTKQWLLSHEKGEPMLLPFDDSAVLI